MCSPPLLRARGRAGPPEVRSLGGHNQMRPTWRILGRSGWTFSDAPLRGTERAGIGARRRPRWRGQLHRAHAAAVAQKQGLGRGVLSFRRPGFRQRGLCVCVCVGYCVCDGAMAPSTTSAPTALRRPVRRSTQGLPAPGPSDPDTDPGGRRPPKRRGARVAAAGKAHGRETSHVAHRRAATRESRKCIYAPPGAHLPSACSQIIFSSLWH